MAIVEVIKYNGGPEIFAWKYPSEELGTWTQLIVSESQEAVLFKGGQALDTFGPGRHTLSTANIPILSKLINLPFGGRSPFTAEVWFINKVHSMDIKWGTPTPIQLQDPKYGVFVPVRAFGQFGIQVMNARQFLIKLVGTMSIFTKETITQYFRGLYLTKSKDSISSYLVKQGISILEINAYLDELSEYLKERMQPTMEEYGINLLNFYVNDINVPEDDSAVKQLKAALAKKAEMNIVGYNYVQERSFDTLEGAAKNTSSGSAGIMGAGLGMGMGVSLGGAMGGQFGGVASNLNVNETKNCTKCQSIMDKKQRFCPHCGQDSLSQAEVVQKESTPVETPLVSCDKCGHQFSKKAKFCPECGDSYNPCQFCGADMDVGATVCSKCGKKAPKPCPGCGESIVDEKMKFCAECGHSLHKHCGNCKVKIEGNPKFCPECGNKL